MQKKQVEAKCYLQMLHLILFFHQRSTIPYGMKIVKHTCYTNMNIYKQFQLFYILFTIYFDLLFIKEHVSSGSKLHSAATLGTHKNILLPNMLMDMR